MNARCASRGLCRDTVGPRINGAWTHHEHQQERHDESCLYSLADVLQVRDRPVHDPHVCDLHPDRHLRGRMDPHHTLEAVRRHLRPDSRHHARHRALRAGGRAPLPLHHHAGRLLPAHRQLGQHPQGVGRRHGHLRRHLRRHLGGVPVVPPPALSVPCWPMPSLRRCW